MKTIDSIRVRYRGKQVGTLAATKAHLIIEEVGPVTSLGIVGRSGMGALEYVPEISFAEK